MARRANYGFAKKQKELKQQKKKQDKAEKKRLKREGDGDGTDDMVASADGDPGSADDTP